MTHPSHEMLAGYAAGTASEGVSLLVAAHATWCPVCRDEIDRIEALSAALMRTDGRDAAPPSLDALLARLDEELYPAAPEAPPVRDPVLPRPVVEAVGATLSQIRWRFLMPGVARCDIPSADDEQVSLLRVRPGCGVPAHTHTGEEATLVLCGALSDRGRLFGPGDVTLAGAADDHHPRAAPGADCICLAVISGGVRFTGPFGRALNLFAE